MATVLFPAGTVGLIVLPLMLFHQAQLMICAVLARRWAGTFVSQPKEDEPEFVAAPSTMGR